MAPLLMDGDLAALFDREARTMLRDALEDVTAQAGRTMTMLAAEATPKESGQTAERWRTSPVTRATGHGSAAWEVSAENPSHIARFLELGVRPHEISPEQAKAIETEVGPRGGAHHPGLHGRHMTLRALEELEVAIEAGLAEPRLEAWATAVERRAEAGGDVR